MTDAQIKYMVDRFLAWKLPANFAPDAGISYTRPNYPLTVDATPSGTNLFDALQAEAMVRHMIDDLPSEEPTQISDDDRPLTGDEQAMIDAAWEKHKAARPV